MTERTVPVRYEAKISGYLSAVNQMKATTRGFAADSEAKIKKVGTNWEQMGTRAQVAGLALGAVVVLATKRFADFDQAMSAASAALPDAGAKMDDLRQLAIKLGADTQYSATEAAQGITEMGKAGASAADILNGGLKGALDLAAAGQLSVADAAGIAATAVKQYNLAGADVTHVADLYAAAAGKALGSVQDIAQAQKYASVAANSLGISIEETTATLGLFASKGILGEQAGTTFRSMLLSLTSPSKLAKTAMDDLGISVYDASGKFVGIQGAADELRKKLGPLDEATRNQALGQIFGNEAIGGAITLYEGGASAISEWTDKVNDAGFAARQAAKLTDNWKGDIERLGGSLDSVFVKNGSAANGMLRSLTQSTEDAVDAFGSLPEPVQVAGLGLTALTAGGLLLGGTFLSLVPKVLQAKTAVVELGIVSETSANRMVGLGKAAGIVGAGAVGLAAVAQAMDAIGKEIADLQDIKATGVEDATGSILDGAKGVDQFNKALSNGTGTVSTFDTWSKRLVLSTRLFGGGMDAAKESVKNYDSALAGLVTSGHPEQAATFLSKAGVSSEYAAKKLPQYTAALKGADNQARLAGDSTKKLATSTEDAAKGLIVAEGATAATSSAMLILGSNAADAKDQVEELAKTIQADMDAAASAFSRDLDVLSQYDPASAAEKAKAATERVKAAELDAQDVRERVAAKKKRTVADTQALDRAAAAVDKARADEKQANAERGAAGLEAMYRSSIDQAKRFTKDITTAAQRGLDPQVVAKLLQEGPTKAAPALQALLGKNSANLIKMTNDSEAQIRALNASVVEQARLTAIAVAAPTDALVGDLGTAMGIAQVKAGKGGKATAEEIAKQLKAKVPDIERIAAEFGITLRIPAPEPVPITADGSAARAEAARAKRAMDITPPRPVMISADTTPALLKVGQLQTVVDQITGKTIHIYAIEHIQQIREAGDAARANAMQTANSYATGAAYGKPLLRRSGGLVDGPGTATSDSVHLRASKGEYVSQAAAVDFYGKQFFDAVNSLQYVPTGANAAGPSSRSYRYEDSFNFNGPIVGPDLDTIRRKAEDQRRLQRLGRRRAGAGQ